MDTNTNTESKWKLVPVCRGLLCVVRRSDNLSVAVVGSSFDKKLPWELRWTDFHSLTHELKFRTLAEVRNHLEVTL